MAVTGCLLLLALIYAALCTWTDFGQAILLAIHGVGIVVGLLVAWFIRPYEKWLWNKLGKYTNASQAILFICAIVSWVLVAFGVSWATIDLFFSFGWAFASLTMFSALWHLPRIRKFNA